jgi:hypothetical protein
MEDPQHPAHVRISLELGEFEVSGPEAFISTYQETIDELLGRLKNLEPKQQAGFGSIHHGRERPRTPPSEFPELLHALPKSATDTDRMLLAGFFLAGSAPDATFATGDANKLLIEQGVKVTNPSQCMTNNLKAKRAFKSGRRYKVSTTGQDYLHQLVPTL